MGLADQTLRAYRVAMSRVGAVVTVRRYAGKGAARAVAAQADAMARITGYAPQEIVGAVQQGDRKVILINDPYAAVPAGKVALATLLPLSALTDRLVISGAELEIHAVDDQARSVAGQLVAFEIQVRG